MAILWDSCSMEAEQDDGLLFEYNETLAVKNSGEKLDTLLEEAATWGRWYSTVAAHVS